MSQLYNINAVFSLVDDLYGIEPDTEKFEDVALVGWEEIGNKHTRLYKYVADVEDGEIKLPCNAVHIESVTIPINDAQLTSNSTDFLDINSIIVEDYIASWEVSRNAFNQKGKLVDYRDGDDTLYFPHDYKNVTIIYHGIIADEETGLPLINDKEMKAIAAFVAWKELYREGLRKRSVEVLKLAADVERQWLRKCNAARVKEHLSQNDMNSILDVKYRWDRKSYGKSLKPIK